MITKDNKLAPVVKTCYATGYLSSSALSILGNSLVAVVLPVLIIYRLGSPTWAGIVAVTSTSAQVCAGMLGGAIADRVNRRNLSIIADLLSALSVFALFLIDWTGHINASWFIILGIVGAFADVPGQTARQALGPQVATSSSITHEKITGFFQTIQGSALAIGPALAGVFLLLPDPSWALFVTGCCSCLAAVITALLPHSIGEYVRTSSNTTSVAHQAKTAFALIKNHSLLRFGIVFSLGINVLYAVTQSFILPTYYTLLGQRERVGLIIAVMGAGMIIGGVLYGFLSTKFKQSTLFLSSTVLSLAGALFILSLWDMSFVLNGAFFLGVAFAILSASATIAIMNSLPEGTRGSVMGITFTLILTAYPLVFGVSTLLYAYNGLDTVRLVVAIGFAVIAVGTLLSRQPHALDMTTTSGTPTPHDAPGEE